MNYVNSHRKAYLKQERYIRDHQRMPLQKVTTKNRISSQTIDIKDGSKGKREGK